MIIEGTLNPFFENGTSKLLWTLEDDTENNIEGLYILRNEDFIKIYDGETIIWQNVIRFKSNTTEIRGYESMGIPDNANPDKWIKYFFDNKKALLIRN